MAELVQAGTYEELLALGHAGGFVVTSPPDKRGLYFGGVNDPLMTPGGVLSAPAIRGYGSSLILAEGHISVASDRWMSKLAAALRASVEMNYGISGGRLLTTSGVSYQGWALPWNHQITRLLSTAGSQQNDVRPPAQPVICLQYGINDAGNFAVAATYPNFQATFRAALEAITRALRAGFAFADTDGRFAYLAGGWNTNVSAFGKGGTSHSRASNGSLTWTSNNAGFLGGAMTFYALVRPDDAEVWRCRAKINGGAYVTTVDVTAGYGVSGETSIVPIHVPGVPAGTGQVVQLDFDNVGAGGFSFIGATLESQWPPIIVLVDQPYTPTMPPGSWPNLTTAILDGLNASHSAVAALFPDGYVRRVSLAPMNSVAAYWQDDLHFNPNGHGKIADLVMTSLKAIPGGIPVGYGAGPVRDFAGKPDWSSPPGMVIYDNSTPKVWFSKSITAADWVGVVVA